MTFNIPKNVEYILARLYEFGHDAFIVGGCVRDCILDKEPNDWDICTSATPDDMKIAFLYDKIIETGIQHGTLTVVIDDIGYEITTYRTDGTYSDGRHPDNVSFTSSLKEDLSRRDFTINSLAYDLEKGIIDYFGGVADIENKIIRCVGDSNKRFTEDALRIMRALRFSVTLGFSIHQSTHDAMFEHRDLLKNISIERCTSELNKILTSNTKNMSTLIPYLKIIRSFFGFLVFYRDQSWEQIVTLVESLPNDLAIRLAALCYPLHQISINQTKSEYNPYITQCFPIFISIPYILKQLKYDNKTIQRVGTILHYTESEEMFDSITTNIKIGLNKISFSDLVMILIFNREYNIIYKNSSKDIEHQKFSTAMNRMDIIISHNECYSLKQLMINGNDLIDLGIFGKNIGYVLNHILHLVMTDKLENTKDVLSLYALKMV